MECLSCGKERAGFYGKTNNYTNYRCNSCGLIFVWPKPEFKNIHSLYSEEYFHGASEGFGFANYESDKKTTRRTFDFFLKELEKIRLQKGTLLDVGCATGYFMELAEKNGWDTSGIDISDYAAKKAKERNLNVFRGTLDDNLFRPVAFNVVTMFDVLEHLPEPLEALNKIKSILKSNGILIINTPDSSSRIAKFMGRRWHLIHPPEHLYLFNKNNLNRLLDKNGFKVLKTGKVSKSFTLKYILRFLINKRILPIRLFDGLAKNAFLGRLSLPINLRDNFFIIAQKND